jgi:hypothetical protein
MHQQVKKVSIRAGSLLVWNSELPHCNYPNNSQCFRLNQYVKMFPCPGPCSPERREIIAQFTQNLQLTDLNRKVLGLDDW